MQMFKMKLGKPMCLDEDTTMTEPTIPKTGELIILVDPDDQPIGLIEKQRAHQYGMLHRAFSVIIVRERDGKLETLLQQRQEDKYHSGGLWTNSCCSHPHEGESLLASAEQRLKAELGIDVNLKEVGKFHYIASFTNGLVENEIDHVLIGYYAEDTIPFNHNEVANVRWMPVSDLYADLRRHGESYTPWLKRALDIAMAAIEA